MRRKELKKGCDRTRSQTVRCLPKLALGVATATHWVLSLWTGTGGGADHPHFGDVVTDAWGRNGCGKFKVVADAGYDAEAAPVWARQGLGLTTLVPPRHGRPRQDGGPPGGYWRKRMVRMLNSKAHRQRHGYTQRSQAETTNSMMKRHRAGALAGQTAWSRKRDMMLKDLTHNLMILKSGGLRQSRRGSLKDPFLNRLLELLKQSAMNHMKPPVLRFCPG